MVTAVWKCELIWSQSSVVSSQATTEYATMSEDPAGYPRAFVVKRLITFVGIVIG